ncbi:hypothetical protein MRBLMR1_003720 [Neorhizobium sp. LMR1-1-1.1]
MSPRPSPMTQAQVGEMWIADRPALSCYRRHLALRNFIIERDDALPSAYDWAGNHGRRGSS